MGKIFYVFLGLLLIGFTTACSNDDSGSKVDSDKVEYVLNAKN